MPPERSYGVLNQISHEALEFVVDGRVQRTWRLQPPIDVISDLIQRCLTALGNEGWRPISHKSSPMESVVLARVPYTAGSKLSTYGTLRFVDGDILVLTVSGAAMQRWSGQGTRDEIMTQAIADLERQGWRLHRRYRIGATVVRG